MTDEPSWQPDLARYANHYGVTVSGLEDLYRIKDLVFISLEFDKIINPKKFLSDELYNVHFSLLPAYKGVYTSYWPIMNGEVKSGVTIHKIEKGIDTGDILFQKQFELPDTFTSRDLYLKYMNVSKELFKECIDSILSRNFVSKAQSFYDSSYYSLTSFDFNPQINLNQTALSVMRQCRALTFREYQLPKINNLEVTNAVCTENKSKKKAGTVLLQDDELILSTIDYDVKFEIDYSMRIFDLISNGTSTDLVNMSLKKTFNVNITNSNGWSALMQSIFQGKNDLVFKLVELGADVNQTNCNGTTPLMYAASYAEESHDIGLFKFLLSNGANLHHKDEFGYSVKDYVEKNKNSKIIDFIRKYSD